MMRPLAFSACGFEVKTEAEISCLTGLKGDRSGKFRLVESVGGGLNGFERDGSSPVAGKRVAGEDMRVATLLPDGQA